MLRSVLITSYFALATSVAAVAAPIASTPPTTGTLVQRVQSSCDNWQRECARLYGRRTEGFQLCMQQPNALRDCSRRSRGRTNSTTTSEVRISAEPGGGSVLAYMVGKRRIGTPVWVSLAPSKHARCADQGSSLPQRQS